MIIGVDGSSFSEEWGGMQYFARELLKQIKVRHRGQLKIFGFSEINDERLGRLHDCWSQVPFPFASRVLREQVGVGIASSFKADRLFVPAYLGPLMTGCPVDLMVYDLLYLQEDSGLTGRQRWYWHSLHKLIFDRADNLFPLSHTTREKIEDIYPKLSDKIGPVLYPGLRPMRGPSEELPILSNKPFLLFVGTISPRKNVERLIRWFTDHAGKINNDLQLVLAGAHGWGEPGPDRLNRPERGIHWLGRVSDSVLHSLYRESSLLILPSKGEGFGMPILESFRHRTPVVLSDIKIFREVAGDAGWYLDPLESRKWTDVIGDCLGNPRERKRRISRGCRRLKRFKWSESADRYLSTVVEDERV